MQKGVREGLLSAELNALGMTLVLLSCSTFLMNCRRPCYLVGYFSKYCLKAQLTKC